MSGAVVSLLIVVSMIFPGRAVPGQVDVAPGDSIDALAQARAAVERAPWEFGPALDLARALTALGRAEDALAAFARARELEPDGAGGREAGRAAARASVYLIPALLLRDLDRTGEAIWLLEQGTARRLGSAEAWEQLALLQLAEGRADEALAAIDAAAAENLDSPEFRLIRGLALARDPARRSEALNNLRQALADRVGQPLLIHLEAADILTAEARYPEALEHLRAAEELAGDDPEVHYRLGRTFAAAGDRDQAEAALERYRSLQGARERLVETERAAAADLAAGLSEARGLAAAGELDAALRRLNGLVESRPRDEPRLGDAQSLRSKVLFSMGRVDEAAASAAEARRLEPNRIEHHYLEGRFLHTAGRAEDAAVALGRALALDPDLGEAHALLGMIAAEAGRYAEAAARMERALELGLDNNASIRFNYARVLEALGRGEEAKVQLEAFERLGQLPPP